MASLTQISSVLTYWSIFFNDFQVYICVRWKKSLKLPGGIERATDAGRLGSIPGRDMLKTWKTILAGILASCSALVCASIGSGTGGPHGPRHPHFYFWGVLAHPLLRLNIISLSNTIGIGSLKKKRCRIFAVFCRSSFWYSIWNSAGFRNSLAECTAPSLSPCYG